MERIDKVQNLIPEKPEFVHSNQEKGEAIESLKIVNRPVVKKDAAALVTGKSVYTNDLAPSDCLIVKVIRSPYAHALIKDINTARAEAVPGIECVLTYKDCPDKRFTMAGQTYPEPSPYDRLILDQRVRFVGDAAAIVAGTSEEAVKKAMKLVKIQYEVLEPVLDFRTAKDNPILVHPEDNWRSLCPVGADNKRNLCAHDVCGDGDVEAVLAKCDHVIDRVYHTKANQQAMMETFRTYTYLDAYGRLNVVSSTQVPFHARRILAHALDIPKSKVRVIKPRIGGGFGAKQTVVSEVYPALVTWKTGKPAKIIYTREESLIASSPRHEMELHVRLGADKEGNIKAIDLYTLSNTGAFGEHGPTTVGLSGHKSIPLYGKTEAFRFTYDVVYTNVMSAGAYRGYGATQGQFAVESAVNELAEVLGMDPTVLREKNMVRQGDKMPAYYGEVTNSCTLDRCLARAKEMINWDEKYPYRDMGNGKVRSVGVAMSMQGSGISAVDTGAVEIKVNDGKEIKNELIYGSVSGKKIDENGEALEGAVIGIFKAEETEFTKDTALMTTTSAKDGSFSFAKVPYGKWIVREIEQPKGFVLDEKAYEVNISKAEQVVEIEIVNEYVHGNIRLTKVDAEYPDNKLTGATFEVYKDTNENGKIDDGDELIGNLEETETGIYEMKELLYGKYIVRETKAPEGFLLDKGEYSVFIEKDETTYSVENKAGVGFINEAMRGTLKIVKTSSDGKVKGFAFRVTGANGYDMTFETDKNGEIVIEGLRIGEYTVSEVANNASAAYITPADQNVTIKLDETAVVKMHNELRDTPKTGDDTNMKLWYVLAGLSAVGIAVTSVVAHKKKKKEGNE